MAFSPDGFDRTLGLPPGLTIADIKNAIEFVEEKAEELIDLYFEQANIFSGVINLNLRSLTRTHIFSERPCGLATKKLYMAGLASQSTESEGRKCCICSLIRYREQGRHL